MYAVIKAGGKQLKVQPGDVIEIELMHRGHDESVTFTPILVVDDDGKTHYGRELARAQVKGKLVGQEKGEKVKVFKYRPKTGYTRRQGHRQMHTLVEILEVTLPKRAAAKKTEGEKEAPAPAEPTAAEDSSAAAESSAAGGESGQDG